MGWPLEKGTYMFDALALESIDGEFEDDDTLISSDELLLAQSEFDEFFDDVSALESANETIVNLEQLLETIEKFGVTKSVLAFSNRDNLLSTAIPAFAACEALDGDAAPGSDEAENAKSSTVDTIKSTVAGWFKKAWDVVSGFGEKVVSWAKAGYQKSVDAAKWVAGKTYDAAKAAKDVIVAHPIASILTAIGALAAISGVAIAIWGAPFPETLGALGGWKTSVIGKFRTAGGQAILATETGIKKASGGLGAAKKATGNALGYTKDNFTRLTNDVKSTFSEGGKVAGFGKTIAGHAKTALDKVKSLGGEAGSAARQAISWLVKIMRQVWVALAITVGTAISAAYSAFRGFFTTNTAFQGRVPFKPLPGKA